MAGAAGVDDAIWPCGILRARTCAKRMSSLRGEILILDNLNQTLFAHFNTGKDFPIGMSKTASETALGELFLWRR
jgi:hypothetical protein